MSDYLPFTRPSIDQATIDGVAEVLRSGWITPGPQAKAFEARLSEYFGGRPVRALASGTGALELALQLAGVGPGDEVVTTPLSWVATANVVLRAGARPVFVDIGPATSNIDPAGIGGDLLEAAQRSWDEAVELGERHGYRNAQASVIAPTGTIGLVMDCDTTGVEPEYSLVKWKKLAGGGYIKIVNQSLTLALRALSYDEPHVADIIRYILGTQSLEDGGPIDLARLKELGFSDDEIHEAAQAVALSGQLNDYTPHVNPQSLRERGMGEAEIEDARVHIGGRETIEGAPHVKAAHLPVFDCANRCGRYSERFLAPMAHVKMIAAVQPFISGAISKTINMPEQSTVQEIEELYVQAWRSGLKAVALYRDNSKGSQPLSAQLLDKKKEPGAEAATAEPAQPAALPVAPGQAWGERRELPRRRTGFTLEASGGAHQLFLRTGD